MGHCWIEYRWIKQQHMKEFIISVIAHVENAGVTKPCVQFKQNSSIMFVKKLKLINL